MANSRPLGDQFREASELAMRQLGDWLEQRFTEELSDAKWEWPTEPSPRDIVDSGRLRGSMQRQSGPGREEFSWPTAYAAQVHEGASLTNGQRLPGRPWTRQPLQEAPEVLQRFLREELRRRGQG